MPRRRKTMSGAPAQQIKSVPGQRYGEGVQQAQMQQRMPVPATRNQIPQVSQTRPPAVAQQPPQQVAQQPQQQVDPMIALQAMPRGIMRQPDTRPVTSGMPFGAGRGPEALGTMAQKRRPSTRLLQMLYDTTNDPTYARLLEQFNR
jgi:hypothetical protein